VISAGIKKLMAGLSDYLDRVREGEELIVTIHGKEVAMIVPITPERLAGFSAIRGTGGNSE